MTSILMIGVSGALGRMGSAVEDLVRSRASVTLAGRFDRPEADDPSGNGVGLTSMTHVLETCDVVIDFSTASAACALAAAAAAAGGPALVIGATGFSAENEAWIERAAQRIAIVKSGNFSVGVNVLAGLVEQAARRLGPEAWDIEVIETHHRRKIDAPSGTALMLAEAAARGRGRLLADIALGPREGITGPRPEGGVGMASVRGGGVIGEHAVLFAGEEETITLSHSARDRALFARGAVEAAVWVADKPLGLYDMIDVLGFREQAVPNA